MQNSTPKGEVKKTPLMLRIIWHHFILYQIKGCSFIKANTLWLHVSGPLHTACDAPLFAIRLPDAVCINLAPPLSALGHWQPDGAAVRLAQ